MSPGERHERVNTDPLKRARSASLSANSYAGSLIDRLPSVLSISDFLDEAENIARAVCWETRRGTNPRPEGKSARVEAPDG